ncbi:MAG TPA: OmpA family protein [Polyangia bacterium]|jgi:outer membrane protein OmpA-like peptidoglycan-associated protein
MNRTSSIRFLAMATATGALLALGPTASSHAAEDQVPPGAPLPAQAGDFALKVEPGLAFPLTAPQSQRFKTGGGETLKALWGLTPYLDLGPSAAFLALPSKTGGDEAGTAWAFGGSVRLKRPHHDPAEDIVHALSPWVDVDALYVRTGGLNRPAFAAAAGLSAPLGAARSFWLGPFVRYLEILQSNRSGYDTHDAKILSVGLSLEVGSGVRRQPPVVAVAQIVEARPVTRDVFICPDRDNDDVPDKVDRCPDVAGPLDNWGCPAYQKLVVKKDKLELKEKLYFAWNQAVLQEVSFPVLDEVVTALNDNKGFRVQVEGHSSSEGDDDHNQTLSEKRAEAVLAYLVAHGIDKQRLVSKGFASSVPIDTNATAAGRENNRRVEFVVNFTIVNDGSK